MEEEDEEGALDLWVFFSKVLFVLLYFFEKHSGTSYGVLYLS
jgi:hypothetical protein